MRSSSQREAEQRWPADSPSTPDGWTRHKGHHPKVRDFQNETKRHSLRKIQVVCRAIYFHPCPQSRSNLKHLKEESLAIFKDLFSKGDLPAHTSVHKHTDTHIHTCSPSLSLRFNKLHWGLLGCPYPIYFFLVKAKTHYSFTLPSL